MDDILDQISTPEQLGTLLDNLPADDLDAAIGAVGAEQVLDRVLRAMEERFRPDRAGEAEGVARFRVTGPGGGTYERSLAIGAGAARAAKGTTAAPTATFTIGLPDFLRLAAGRLNALDGVTSGRLQVDGDLRFAARLMGWFDLGPAAADPLAGALAGIRTPRQLAALLDGRSDRDINDFAAVVGVASILDQAFREMEQRFLPEKAAGRSAVVQWNVGAPDGTVHEWHITVGAGACTAAKGKAEAPSVTLGFRLPDFMRLAANRLSGVQGVMTGKIKVSGNLMLAAAMESWFAR